MDESQPQDVSRFILSPRAPGAAAAFEEALAQAGARGATIVRRAGTVDRPRAVVLLAAQLAAELRTQFGDHVIIEPDERLRRGAVR